MKTPEIDRGVTFVQALQKLSEAEQDSLLGPERGKLFRAGKLPADWWYANNFIIKVQHAKQND